MIDKFTYTLSRVLKKFKNAMSDNIVNVIDIRSDKISILTAKITNDSFDILAHCFVEAKGVDKGYIKDIPSLSGVIKEAIDIIEDKTKLRIRSAVVSFPGEVKSIRSKTLVDLDDAPRSVTKIDLINLERNSTNEHIKKGDFVIDRINYDYSIDGSKVSNPVGMMCSTLEASSHIFAIRSSAFDSLNEVFKNCGIRLDGVVPSSLANGYATLTKREKSEGSIAINIGDSASGLAIFRDNKLIYLDSIAVGERHILRDIANVLDVDINVAKMLKDNFNSLISLKEDYVDIPNVGKRINVRYLAAIVHARLEEIAEMLFVDTNLINSISSIKSVVINGPKIDGLQKIVSELVKIDTRVEDFNFALPKTLKNNKCSSLIGLVIFEIIERKSEIIQNIMTLGDIFDKIREFIN